MLSLLAESWTWYSFAALIICARFVSRWLQLGSIKRYQIEDYVMLAVFCFYTVLVSVMNIVAHLDSNLMLPSDIPLLTPQSIQSRIRGSKLTLLVEQSMIHTIWGCKICLLLLYHKLTFGLRQQLAVKIVGGYVVGNYIVMEILYFGVWCRPFNQYWAVPTDNVQCSAAIHHLITNAVFNISSDVMMLCIPLPLLITSRLPRTKKLLLCILFSLGIFVIMCAVLNKYYSFAHPFSPMWTYWYIREASTAIMVANAPMCWTLVRRIFNVKGFLHQTSEVTGKANKSVPVAATYGAGTADGTMNGKVLAGKGGIVSGGGKGEISWWERESRLGRTESEEYIVGDPNGRKDVPLEIWESREVDVERGSLTVEEDKGMRTMDRMFDGKGHEYESTVVIEAIGKNTNGSGRKASVGRKSSSSSRT